MADKILYHGAYHMIGDDSYEPQRTNNFEIHIYGLSTNMQGNASPLKTVDQNHEISEAEAQLCLTLSASSVGDLVNNVSVLPIAYGNTKVKYAGVPEINNVSIVYNDYIGKNTERVIAAWHAKVFNPKTEVIGRASDYKKRALLIETAPDGSAARTWQLNGVWPSQVSYGGYDYNSNNVRQVTMTLEIDQMIPLDDSSWQMSFSKEGIATLNKIY